MLAHLPRRLWQTGREAAAAYSLNLCPQLASAIAYRVLFSLFPLAIFLVSIFGLLIENDERRNEIVTWIVDNLLLSTEGSVRLDEAVAGVATPTSALGLVALAGRPVGRERHDGRDPRRPHKRLGHGAQAGLARQGVRPLARPPRRSPAPRRLLPDPGRPARRGHGSKVGSALGLEELGSAAGDLAQLVTSLAVVFATVLVLYHYVPPVRPRFADLWAPALLVAVAIQVTQVGYGIYLSRFADYNLVYGSLAAVIGFLVLVYLCAAIFLFGAQAAAVWVAANKAAGRR